MTLSAALPLLAMAGVGVLFVLTRVYADGARLTATARAAILAFVAAVFIACSVAAAGTALQISRIGLAGTPPPGTFGTFGRLAGVALAMVLWPFAQRHIERAAIFTFVVGAGSAGLVGLGLRSVVLDGARTLYHLLMFACGAILAAAFTTGVARHAGATLDK
jgi:hypothetical protein